MDIKDMIFVKSNIDGYEVDENSNEYLILDELINLLPYSNDNFEITKPALSYTTLKYKNNDIVRLEFNDNYQVIRVRISSYDRDNEIDNPLFDKQTNKGQVFWESYYDELNDYLPFIQNTIDEIDNSVAPEFEIPEAEKELFIDIVNRLGLSSNEYEMMKYCKVHSNLDYKIDGYNKRLIDVSFSSKNKFVEFVVPDKKKYKDMNIFKDSKKDTFCWRGKITNYDADIIEICKIVSDEIERIKKESRW